MKKVLSLLSAVLLCMTANAQTNLADVIKNAVENAKVLVNDGVKCYEVAPVTLTESSVYVLDSQVDLGMQDVVIFGGGAKVIVKGEGQIATGGYLKVYGVNFDCAEGTAAPIALSPNPDPSQYQFAEGDDKPRCQGANQKVYFNDNVVRISNCNFRELKTSLFYANKAAWALNTLAIENCIVQLNHEKGDPVINLYGSSTGAIKHIIMTNNTLYNIKENSSSYFIRYGNASNAQPQKIWGTQANGEKETSDFVMQNNTLCQTMSGKDFANNFPNTSNVILDWKKNIFFNTYRLQKIGQNNTRKFEATDNVIWSTSNVPAVDATDKTKFATEVDPGFTVPTTALEFDNIEALSDYFTNKLNDAKYSVYGSTVSNASASSDALTTGISNVKTQGVAPKKYINANGQIVIGNYNIAGQRVK